LKHFKRLRIKLSQRADFLVREKVALTQLNNNNAFQRNCQTHLIV
jgi:hypothetical protein